jgi:hypothetical protein
MIGSLLREGCHATDHRKHSDPIHPPGVCTGTGTAELPISEAAARTTLKTRREIQEILRGRDGRLVVVVGPCSIHDPEAALDYAARLKAARSQLQKDLLIVMRVYFEKPRTTVGWKGLIGPQRRIRHRPWPAHRAQTALGPQRTGDTRWLNRKKTQAPSGGLSREGDDLFLLRSAYASAEPGPEAQQPESQQRQRARFGNDVFLGIKIAVGERSI